MQKANGLGSNIDKAIETMKSEYRNNRSLSKKQLYDIAVKAAGGPTEVTKVASRAIWSAVYRIAEPMSVAPEDYRNNEEYR